MQFPVVGPGWDDRQLFWLQLQPRHQSDPTPQTALGLKYPLIGRRHQLPPAHGPAQRDIAGLQSPALIRATSDAVQSSLLYM